MDLCCQVKDPTGRICWSDTLSSDDYCLFTTGVIESDALQAASSAGCLLDGHTLCVNSEHGEVSIVKEIKLFYTKH